MFADQCAVHPETGNALRGEWSSILFGAAIPSYIWTMLTLEGVVYASGGKVEAINRVVRAVGGVYTAGIVARFLLYRRCRPWIGWAAQIVILILGAILIRAMLGDMLTDAAVEAERLRASSMGANPGATGATAATPA